MPLNDILKAKNIKKAHFYSVAVDGRTGFDVFKSNAEKAFYVRCHDLQANSLPIYVMAFSVVTNHAYFVVASYDQTTVSLKRYFDAVKQRYTSYYNTNIKNIGQVFADKLRIKKINPENVFDAVATVHSQPALNKLCNGYDDYEFSSYNKYDGKFFCSMDALKNYFTAEDIDTKFNFAHLNSLNRKIWDPILTEKRKSMDCHLEEILFKYGVISYKKLPAEFLEDVVIELNDRGQYDFESIVSRLFVKDKHKKDLITGVFAKTILNQNITFDEARRKFDIDVNENDLIRDVMFAINSKKGYSYDVIMNMMGFTYPNLGLLQSAYVKARDEFGFTFIQTTQMLGLRDKRIISYLKSVLA